MKTLAAFLGVLLLVALIVVFAPLALIWSINTLFQDLGIPYTMETWAASLIVSSLFGTTNIKRG
jgi:hypothetical protein